MTLYIDFFETPIGLLEIKATQSHILSVNFIEDQKESSIPNELTARCILQLKNYFWGKRKDFDLPLDPNGTDFQKSVWNELVKIPYGKTTSYLALARKLNNEKAIRAVGTSNGQNPIGIIIPCHRVIGSDGSLTGYAGGLSRKKWLLEHEQTVLTGIKQTELFL